MKTCGYVTLVKKMEKPKWDLVLAASILMIDMASIDDDDTEDVNDAANDPCAFLEIYFLPLA